MTVDRASDTTPPTWRIRISREARAPHGFPRTHLGDGRVLWLDGVSNDASIAVDAEVWRDHIPSSLACAAATDDPTTFWTRWTQWEVLAKLTSQPMVTLVQRGALRGSPDVSGINVATRRVGDIVVTVGWRAGSPHDEPVQDRVGDALAPTTVHGTPSVRREHRSAFSRRTQVP